MTVPGEKTSVLDAARAYRARGLYPIPLCVPSADGKRCNVHGAKCSKPGKVPIATGWNTAEPDDAKLCEWFGRDARNVGLALRGMVAFDLDSADGEAELAHAAEALGPLPKTWESITGRGRHLVFRFPEGADDSTIQGSLTHIYLDGRTFTGTDENKRKQAERVTGLDLRAGRRSAARGQIAVAPSLHHTGKRYQWQTNGLDAPAVLPLEWFEALPRAIPKTAPTAGQGEGALFSGQRQAPRASGHTDPKRYAATLASALPSMLASIPPETPESETNIAIRDVALRAFRLALGAGGDTLDRTVAEVTSAALASGHPSHAVHNTVRSSLEAAQREGPPPLSDRTPPPPASRLTGAGSFPVSGEVYAVSCVVAGPLHLVTAGQTCQVCWKPADAHISHESPSGADAYEEVWMYQHPSPDPDAEDFEAQRAAWLDARKLFELEQKARGMVQSTPSGKVQEKPATDPVSVATETLRRCTWGAATPDGSTVAATLRARVARRVSGEERPVVTPWPNLNAAMGGGFWPGLHVLVGSTGTGKSQFAMQLAVTGGVPVLYLALELDALGLYTRAAALLGHGRMVDETGRPLAVSWSDFYTGRVQVPELFDEELAAIPLHWMEAPPHGFSYDGIAPHVAALRALHPTHTGPVVIVVDFLQLVAGTNAREDLRERIGRASYACRAAARDHDAVILALSSTSREGARLARVDGSRTDGPSDDGEGRRGQFRAADDDDTDPKRPALYDLVGLGKESGDVEYSADSVLTFCPEAWPDGAKPPPGGKRIHVAVAKIRAGAPSWCMLAFDGTRFTEPPETPPRAPDEIIPGNNRKGKGKRSKYGNGNPRPADTNTEPDPFTGEPTR